MINDELKIKIIQYLEGELDKASESEVEEILNSDEEANQFCNQIKSLNIKLNEYTQTNEYQSYSKKVDAAVDSTIEKHLGSKKKSNTFSFVSFFTLQNVTGYALTAALFLSVGLFYDDYFIENEQDTINDLLDYPEFRSPASDWVNLESESSLDSESSLIHFSLLEYIGSPIELDFFKTRSASSDTTLDDIIIESIKELINYKSRIATLSYGTDTFRLELDKKIINLSGVVCYEGTFFSDSKKEFIFCNNNNNFSIFFK